MLRRKDCPIWAIAQVPQKETSSLGILDSSWKEKKSSDYFQTVPSGMGYLDPLEESTWSQNLDSAASMFPPSTFPPTLDPGTWEENFQDLSIWCPKPQQDISSTMAGVTKGSSCIVPDDELNTPEIGVQHEFNFTSPSNVLKEDTSQYQSDGEGWKIPPPLDLLQIPSVETVKKADGDNTQSQPANGFFLNETWALSISHEEIVNSRNQEESSLEEFVQNKESDSMETSVNMCEMGVEHGVNSMNFGNCESVANDTHTGIRSETVENTDIENESFEPLLVSDFNVKTLGDGIFSIDSNQQQADSNLSLQNLLTDNIYHINMNIGAEIRNVDETPRGNTHLIVQTVGSKESFPEDTGKLGFSDVNGNVEFDGKSVTTTNMLVADISTEMEEHPKAVSCKQSENATSIENLPSVTSEPHMLISNVNEEVNSGNVHVMKPQLAVREENATKTNLKLNLATFSGTDEIISTPVVLESLLKQDEPFDLVDYVFSDAQTFHLDSPDLDRISTSGTAEEAVSMKVEPIVTEVMPVRNDVEALATTKVDTTVNVMVVKPFVIERSRDGQWSIAQSEPMEVEEEENRYNQSSSSNKLFGKLDLQVEGQRKSDVKKVFKGNKGEQFQNMQETGTDLPPCTKFGSRILQDGSALKRKIPKSKISAGQASSTKVLSSQKQVSPRKNITELEELSSSKLTRGHPVKRICSSASKEKNITRSTNRSLCRKLSSSSGVDEPWTPPSKRSRHSSVDSECDRYRELRDRNNEASRKSRQNRKARESEMKETASKLERENQSLKIKADEMERLVKKLREALLEAVVKTKKE